MLLRGQSEVPSAGELARFLLFLRQLPAKLYGILPVHHFYRGIRSGALFRFRDS